MLAINADQHHNRYTDVTKFVTTVAADKDVVSAFRPSTLVSYLKRISKEYGLQLDSNVPTLQLSAPATTWSLSNNYFSVHVTLSRQTSRGINSKLKEIQESPPFVALVTFAFNGSEPVPCSELAQDLNRCKYSSLSKHVRNILSFFSVPGDGYQQARAYLCLQAVEQDLDLLARANLPLEATIPATTLGRSSTSDDEMGSIESHCKLVNRSLVGLFRPRSGGRLAQLAYLVTPAQKAMAKSSINDLVPAARVYSQASVAGRRLLPGGLPGFLARITLRPRSVPPPGPTVKQEAVCPSKVLPRIQFIPFVTREEGGHVVGGLHFAEPNEINCLAIEAELVLLLDPPLPLPAEAVRLLEQVTGLSNTELVVSEKADLVYHILARHNQRHLYGVNPHLQMPNMTQHSYQLHSALNGYLVRSVPFTCSSQLSQIMDILRQHASTSAFLESFVLHPRRATEKDNAMTFHFNIDILSSREIVVKFDHPCELGRKMHVSLQIGKFSVDSVHLNTTSDASSKLSDGLTEILRKCHVLPVGLVWLLTRLGCPVHRSLPLPKPVAAPLLGNQRKRKITAWSDDFRHLKKIIYRASSHVIIEGVAGSDGLLSGADHCNLHMSSLPPVASTTVTSTHPAIANSLTAGFLGGIKLPPGVLVATPPPPIATAAASTSRGVRLDDLLMVDNNMCQLQQSRTWPPPGGLIHDPSNRQPNKPHPSATGLPSGGLGNRAGEYGPTGGKLVGNHGPVANALGSVNRSGVLGQSTLPTVPPAPPISIPGTFIQTATMGSQTKLTASGDLLASSLKKAGPSLPGSMLVNLLNEEPSQPSSTSLHSNHHHHQQHHYHSHQKSTSSPQHQMHQQHIPNPGAGGFMNPSSSVSASSSASTISSVIQQPTRQQPAPPPPPLPGLLDTSRYTTGPVVAAGSHQRPCPPPMAYSSNVGKTFSSPTPTVTSNSSSISGAGGVSTSGPTCVSPVTVPSFSSMVSSLLPASVSSSPIKNLTSVRSSGKPLGRSSSNAPSAGIHRHSSATPVSEFGKKTRKRRRVSEVGSPKSCANSAPPGGNILSQPVRTRLGDTGSNGLQLSRSGPVSINSVPIMGTAGSITSGTRPYSAMPHSELVSSASVSLPLSLPQLSGVSSSVASKSVYDFDDNPNTTFDMPSSVMVLPQATVCTTDTISAGSLGNSFNVGGGGGVGAQATCVTSRLSSNVPAVSSGLAGAASGQQLVTSGTPLSTGMTPERTVERKTSLKMTIKTLPALQPPLGVSHGGSISKPPAHRLSKLTASGGAKITSPTGRHSAGGIDGKHKLLLSGQVAMKKRRRRSIEGKPQSYFLQMQQHSDTPSSSASVSAAAAVVGQFPSGKDGGNRMGKLNMASLKACISSATLKKERKRRSVAGGGANVPGLAQLPSGSSGTGQGFETVSSSGHADAPVDAHSLMKLTGKATVGKQKQASSVVVSSGGEKQRKLPVVLSAQSFSSTIPGATVGATATPMTTAAIAAMTTTAVTTTGSSPLAVNSLLPAALTSTYPQTTGDTKRRKLSSDAQSTAAANRHKTQSSTTSLFNLSLSSSSQSESDDMTLLLSTAGSDATQQQSLYTGAHLPSSSSFTKLQWHTLTPSSTGTPGSLASGVRHVKSCRASGVATAGTTGGLIKGYKIPKKKNLGEVLGKQTNIGSVDRLDRLGGLNSLAIARSTSAAPPPTNTTTSVVTTAPSAKPLPSSSSISFSCVASSVPTVSAGLTAGSSALLPLPVAGRRSNAKSISDIVDKLRAKSTSMSGVKSGSPSTITGTTDTVQLAAESTESFPSGFTDDLEAFTQQDGRRDNIFEKFGSGGGSGSHNAGRPTSTGLSTGTIESHLGSGLLSLSSQQAEDSYQAEAGSFCSSAYTTNSDADVTCGETTATSDNNKPVADDLATAPGSSRFSSLQEDQAAVAMDSNVALDADRSSPYELIKALTDTPASPTASPKPVRGEPLGSPCDSAGAGLPTLPAGSFGYKGTDGSGSVGAEAASRIIPISPTDAKNSNSGDNHSKRASASGSGGGQKRSIVARTSLVHGASRHAGDHPVDEGGGLAVGTSRFTRPLSESVSGRQVDGFLRNPSGHMRHGRPPIHGFPHSLHRSKPVNFKGSGAGGAPGSTWPGPHLSHPHPRLMDYTTLPPHPPPTSIHPDHPSGSSSFQGVGGGAGGTLPWIASSAATTGPLHGLPPPMPGQQRHLGTFQPPSAALRPGIAVQAGHFPGNTSLFSGSGSMPGPVGTTGAARGASRGKK